MKRAMSGILIMTGMAAVIAAGYWAARAGDPPAGCDKKAVLQFKDDPAFPKDATATVTYCETYTGKATFWVQAEKFPKNAGYLFSINGWNGRPGNDILAKYNKTDAGEGFVDIGSVTSNDKGVITNTAVEYDLPDSTYDVKVFLKQNEKPFTCVMGDDMVHFKVSKGEEKSADTIDFELPENIEGNIISIKGQVSDPPKNVFIIIRGQGSDKWWVQEVPLVEPNGDWEALNCNFGDPGTPTPKKYEVIVVAGKDGEFTEGKTIPNTEISKLLADHPVYKKKTTTRTK